MNNVHQLPVRQQKSTRVVKTIKRKSWVCHFFWTSKWCHRFRDMKGRNLILTGPYVFIFNLICSFCLSSFCTAAPSTYESKMASVEDTNADVPWTDKSTSEDKCLLLFSFHFWKHTWQDYWPMHGCFITNEKFGSEIPCVFRERKWKVEAFCGFDPHTSSWSKTNVDVNHFYGLLPMSVAHWTQI